VISGVVTPDLEPSLELPVIDPEGGRHLVGALVNTGFTGWLTLPPSLIQAMGLSWHEVGRVVVADGRSVLVDLFDATIEWDGEEMPIKVHEMDAFPSVGLNLLRGFELHFPAKIGATFSISRVE
jgi:clan AA aspartic protease